MSKRKKVRVELRKNRTKPPRQNELTRQFHEDEGKAGDLCEWRTGPGQGCDISRHRTVMLDEVEADGMPADRSDDSPVRAGCLRVHGLYSYVETADGVLHRCSVRRLLKSLMTDGRNIVTTGDNVWIRPTQADQRRR